MESTVIHPAGENQDRSPYFLVIVWIFCVLSLIFTLLRAFVRAKILHSTGAYDFLLFVAMVGC